MVWKWLREGRYVHKLVPAIEITFLRYKAFTAAQQRELLRLQAERTAPSTGREA